MGVLLVGVIGQVIFVVSILVVSNFQDNFFLFDLVFIVVDNVFSIMLINIGVVQGQIFGGDWFVVLIGVQIIEGVVIVVEFGLSGFFVQEEGIDVDRDEIISDGLFVYCVVSCLVFSVGDCVWVSGMVVEYGGVIQMMVFIVIKLFFGLVLLFVVELKLLFDKM